MTVTFTLRNETPADIGAITEVTKAAFETLAISQHTEHFIVAALRAAGALTVSLVAEAGGQVIGHIGFSPVVMSDGTPDWYGLGPVSVLPPFQRQGVGRALIQEGLAGLKALGAQGCCLVGHPDYYPQFGFRNAPELVLEGVPPEVFFALSFDGPLPRGTVAFHEGFRANGFATPAADGAASAPQAR
jgi:putative acetyltransferase